MHTRCKKKSESSIRHTHTRTQNSRESRLWENEIRALHASVRGFLESARGPFE